MADVLREVEDPEARRWLEALLTRGESAQGEGGRKHAAEPRPKQAARHGG